MVSPQAQQAREPREVTSQDATSQHLLMHFTRHADVAAGATPTIIRGEGCWVVDSTGRRWFDGLSGLFCAQLGHDFGAEIGAAAAAQLSVLPYFPTWAAAHPPALELAARLSEVAPQGLTRTMFVSGGSEAVETAMKIARQYHALRGQPLRYKFIARRLAYHGSTLATTALSGLAGTRQGFEPLPGGFSHVGATLRLRRPPEESDTAFVASLRAEFDAVIELEGADTIAGIVLEPVQNSGGSIPPPDGYFEMVRALCDEHGILLIADEVICAFGRVGEWFGSQRYGIRADLLTFAKGATAGHAPLGGVMATEQIAEPFLTTNVVLNHGFTFGGHPLATAVALKSMEIMEREQIFDRVRDSESRLIDGFEAMRRLPLVGDTRGAGCFWSVQLVDDPTTRAPFDTDRAQAIVAFLSDAFATESLICRADARSGDVVVTIAPPLVATQAEVDFVIDAVDRVLTCTSERFAR